MRGSSACWLSWHGVGVCHGVRVSSARGRRRVWLSECASSVRDGGVRTRLCEQVTRAGPLGARVWSRQHRRQQVQRCKRGSMVESVQVGSQGWVRTGRRHRVDHACLRGRVSCCPHHDHGFSGVAAVASGCEFVKVWPASGFSLQVSAAFCWRVSCFCWCRCRCTGTDKSG